MRTSTFGRAILILGGLLALAYLAGAVLFSLLLDWDQEGANWGFVFSFLIGGFVLLVAGGLLADRSRRLAAWLISLGAIAGAIPTYWSLVIPVAAIALVVLVVRWTRRPRAATS